GDQNGNPDIERKKSRLRPFVAPADPSLDASVDHDQGEHRCRDGDPRLDPALRWARLGTAAHLIAHEICSTSPRSLGPPTEYAGGSPTSGALVTHYFLAIQPASFISCSWRFSSVATH